MMMCGFMIVEEFKSGFSVVIRKRGVGREYFTLFSLIFIFTSLYNC